MNSSRRNFLLFVSSIVPAAACFGSSVFTRKKYTGCGFVRCGMPGFPLLTPEQLPDKYPPSPPSLTFDEWLAKQTPEIQQAIKAPGRPFNPKGILSYPEWVEFKRTGVFP